MMLLLVVARDVTCHLDQRMATLSDRGGFSTYFAFPACTIVAGEESMA